ncbi:MAG: nucleoside hydrolase [Fimbriimonadaceae bacterium]|nr:nucleoside hydrolase [Fimbriimonadaceae bacterium]
MKVLLDTDIGNDIDDAVALAYLLRRPGCDLIGITTVTGQAQKRAALCEVVCRAAGREDIPIHCGRETPLAHGPGQPNPVQYEAIHDLPHRLDRPLNAAVDFQRRIIRDNPGEITLLSIGPFSNLAILFALDPEIPSLLGGLVSMAGSFFPGAPEREWNCMVDPTACAMVYAADRTDHRSIGLDVTMQCQLSPIEVRDRFIGEPLATVARLAEVWFKNGGDKLTFHDPLAAALLFEPNLCTFESGKVKVDHSGRTQFIPPEDLASSSDQVAKTVDRDRFFREFFAVFEA